MKPTEPKKSKSTLKLQLPQTGEVRNNLLVGIGLVAVSGICILGYYRNKK
ncbi:LPXTG cell wall anchor domain-containing protein [Vagococcus fessus]